MSSAKYLYIAQMFRNQGNMVSAKYWQKRAGEEISNRKCSFQNMVQKRFSHEL